MTIKKIISLIYKPRFLYIKISRRIFSAFKSLKIRIIFYKKPHSAKILYDFHLDEIPNLSTKPGNNLFFDDYYRGEFPYMENDFSNVLLHKINIFYQSINWAAHYI